MKAIFCLLIIASASTSFAYSNSAGTIQVVQNNESVSNLVIHGDAAKAIYQNMQVEEVSNYNDNVPSTSKTNASGTVSCDQTGSNFYCYININSASGEIVK